MKPATEQQKEQVFFMEPKEDIELNVTQTDPQVRAAYLEPDAAQSDFAQNTTTHD